MSKTTTFLALGLSFLSSACTQWSSSPVSVPLELSGSDVEDQFEASDGWRVTLDQAELAFGPVYLCSGITAGDLCDTARMEWLGSAVIDLLDPRVRQVGHLNGTSGEVRSWMYDHGLASRVDGMGYVELDAAEQLGGHSLVLRGVAVRGSSTIPFSLDLQLMQHEETEQGVPLVRKSQSESFYRDVTGEEDALRIRFDPRSWFQSVDFDSYTDSMASEEELVWGEDDQARRAIRNAVIVGERAQFSWPGSSGSGG